MKIITNYKLFESLYDKYNGELINKMDNINSQFNEIRNDLKKELFKKFEYLNIDAIYFDEEPLDKLSLNTDEQNGDILYHGLNKYSEEIVIESIHIDKINNGFIYVSQYYKEQIESFPEYKNMNEYLIWDEAMKKDATNISINYLYYDDSSNFRAIYDKIDFNEFIKYNKEIERNKRKFKNSEIIGIFKTYEFQKYILDNYEDAYILFKQFIDPKIEIEYPFITNMSNIGLI
ncbi:hypothetical protein M0Q50_04810 [bacterium]|jgi:hypothetical protein|nr:hypothetical protein [bacterium]